MKKLIRLQIAAEGLYGAVWRYFLTVLFLIAAATVNAEAIITENDYSKYILTFIVGAFIAATFQSIYERRFPGKLSARLILMGTAVLLTAGYYFTIRNSSELSVEIWARTSASMFALLFAFIWVPVIKSKISFNESFMAAFKAFFISLFFSGIIFGGISLILVAIDQLLITVNDKAYGHTANIVFIIFAPIYFLSLIPLYTNKAEGNSFSKNIDETDDNNYNKVTEKDEKISRSISCPKFLEILISYIIMPLTAVFTLILLIYIIINISGNFWTDNLLEPMLIAYAITVILIYILAGKLENKPAIMFKKIFSKILIPIVLFQVTASVINIRETGLTYGRYYVILFGIFAIASGIVFSTLPPNKNGIIAAMLVIFTAVSVIPPSDAFTVSKYWQTTMLENILKQNNMLVSGSVIPAASASSVSDKDKKVITGTLYYLDSLKYTEKIEWLPENFKIYDDFGATFGFEPYWGTNNTVTTQPINLYLNQGTPFNVEGYDFFIFTHISLTNGIGYANDPGIYDFTLNGSKYSLAKITSNDKYELILTGTDDKQLIAYDISKIFERYSNYSEAKGNITSSEATIMDENDSAGLKLIVQNLYIDKSSSNINGEADIYIFVKIK